jgi:hypothetical protein
MLDANSARILNEKYLYDQWKNFEENNSEIVERLETEISKLAKIGRKEAVVPLDIKHNGPSLESIEKYIKYAGFEYEEIGHTDVSGGLGNYPLYTHVDLKISW